MVTRRRSGPPIVPSEGAFGVQNPNESMASSSSSPSASTAQRQPTWIETLMEPDEMSKRVAPIRDRIIHQSTLIPGLGFRLRANFNVSDVEDLLSEVNCIPRGTRLTAEELESEHVSAWLREFHVYLPSSPAIRHTGQRPPRVASKTIHIPKRLGYTSPTLTTFLTHHVVPLLPSHPLYPPPSTSCTICHELYSPEHPPILIVNCSRCRNHVFGYSCLRKWISSGRNESNRCPLCRTTWFKIRRGETRQVSRRWREVEQREKEAIEREEEAFGVVMGRDTLGARATYVLVEGVMVAGEVVERIVLSGASWIKKIMSTRERQLAPL